ncbi:MAG TPA: lysylphosphatidylglycerol synthase transmembrane domain-containing protein [Cellvibrio sp.]|nr:lysylphosphatidylglycerol synthase transmembrane domain-containing protein [Cellvibrio sp.]
MQLVRLRLLQPKTLSLGLWLFALAMLVLVAMHLPLATLLQLIAELSAGQWLCWILLNIAIILIAVQRWQVLIRLLQFPIGFSRLLAIRQAGQAISFITPGPQFGGEPLQVFWLWKRNGFALHSALLAVGLDRFYELWINFAVLLLSALLLLATRHASGDYWLEIIAMLCGLLLLLSLLVWLLLSQPQRLSNWLKPLTRRWHQHPRLKNSEMHWQQLGSEIKRVVKTQKPGLLLAIGWSLLGWVALLGELWLLLNFFSAEVSIADFLLIFVAMRLSFLLPLPGGIGTLEAAILWSCQSLGVETSAALGVIALMRLRDLVVLAAGLIFWRSLQSAK